MAEHLQHARRQLVLAVGVGGVTDGALVLRELLVEVKGSSHWKAARVMVSPVLMDDESGWDQPMHCRHERLMAGIVPLAIVDGKRVIFIKK